MKIALIGYGKMGKEVEAAALQRGHKIVLKADATSDLLPGKLEAADVAIEFSTPETAAANILKCFAVNLPVVVGTTGWTKELPRIASICSDEGQSLLYASNFSIGVHLFMEVNRKLAALMNDRSTYEVEIKEIHHTEKKDSPSGTAITLADDLIANINRKSKWSVEPDAGQSALKITSIREANVPGTHIVRYTSSIDEIEIRHSAFNRQGFALGAILAAEWLHGRTGVFTMKDILQF